MRKININPSIILLEPFGRNTAPAVTLAAIKAEKIYDDPTLLILSSDHVIKNNAQFTKVIHKGLDYSNRGSLVTFGVIPDSPETGYGYIKAKEPLSENPLIGSKIDLFTEKPNIETAKKFIKDNHYTWNSGMFLFKASEIIKEMKNYAPKSINIVGSLKGNLYDLDFQRLNKILFRMP